jgi:hypothetical protein
MTVVCLAVACTQLQGATDPVAVPLNEQVQLQRQILSPTLGWREEAMFGDLGVTPLAVEAAASYSTLDRRVNLPPEGFGYLWVEVQTQNHHPSDEINLVLVLSIYYEGIIVEVEPYEFQYAPENRIPLGWGDLYGGQSRDGWLLFVVEDDFLLSDAYLLARSISSGEWLVAWHMGESSAPPPPE